MTSQLIHSANLVGVSHLLATASPSRVFASCGDTRTLMCFTVTQPTLTYAGTSAVLDSEPGALTTLSSLLWTICTDGSLRSFSLASVPVQQASYARQCYTKDWLLAYSSILIVPGPCGTLLTVNSSGTVLARAEGIMDRIAMAASDGAGRVYLFDGAGNGLTVSVHGTTGAITLGTHFAPVNCVDLKAALVDGTSLVLVAADRRVIFDLTDPANPVLGSITYYHGNTLADTAILTAGHRYLSGRIAPSSFPVPWAQGPVTIRAGLVTALPGVGSILFENPAIDEGGTSRVISSVPVNTVAPVVSGLTPIGSTLSCTTGTWIGWPTLSYAYQWRRDGVNISLATSSTYVTVTADGGTSVDCVVTATDGNNLTASQDSNNIAVDAASLTWTSRTSPNDTNPWVDVAADGSGTVVAVGYSGAHQFMRSTDDGVTWTAVDAPAARDWYSIAYGNGIWVIVARNHSDTCTSTNGGVTWTLHSGASVASTTWEDVHYGGGVFVAVAQDINDLQFQYSSDGANWTASSSYSPAEWFAVTYGNGVWVAVATTGEIAYSGDVDTWTDASSIPGGTNQWQDVVYGAGLFAVIDYFGRVITSSDDGDHWTQRYPTTAARPWYGIAYGNSKFVVVSLGIHTLFSTDGTTWTAGDNLADNTWDAIAYGQTHFITVAAGHTTGSAAKSATSP